MPSDQLIVNDASGVERPMRTCGGLGVGCGQTDDHPKHTVAMGLGDGDPEYHLDCHAAAGCAACSEAIADRPDGATGQEMLDHLLAQAPTVTQHDVDAVLPTAQEG